MALAQVYSRGCVGVEAPAVTVEVHLTGGLPGMSIVGLPETAVKEARDRVKAALINSGYRVPQRRVTISLAPAELPKVGGGFDLPIALGILAASRQVRADRLAACEFLGELALSGELRAVRGALPAALRASRSGRALVVPRDNGAEAALVSAGERWCADSLCEVTAWLNGGGKLEAPAAPAPAADDDEADLADVVGQQRARRALEITAAGGHNLLMIGPPGTGKTLLASRLPGILPALASISHTGLDVRRWRRRPFRSPHHTCSGVALVGGGSRPRPGEISLAHHGVLFLDELPEFQRAVLDVLREPLESGRIIISRAARQAEFPARFQLVCAMNPCPCGYWGDATGRCHCSPDQVRRYRGRVSGPLLDRIDLQVEVGRPRFSVLDPQAPRGEPSARVRDRVAAARGLQLGRAGRCNALLGPRELRGHCALERELREFLDAASERLALSPRACHRVLRVARTVADLAGEEQIGHAHLTEALSFRRLSSPQAPAVCADRGAPPGPR